MIQFNNKLVFVFLAVFVCYSVQDCTFKYATDFPETESVLLWPSSNGYDLIEPVNEGIVLKANQEIAIACPGGRNVITDVDEELVSAKCVSGQTLKVGSTNYRLSALGCEASVTGEFSPSEATCGKTGVIKKIGHKIAEGFNTLIDVCYDDKLGGSLYANHTVYGSAVNYGNSVSRRPGFKVGGLAEGVSANNAYKQATQLTTFKTILGSSALAAKYIHRNSYLARGHLAPDADQVYVSSQFSTYFYINTVPQWQQINNGNWKSMEAAVRNVAAELGQNIRVYTGSHEVLALEDSDGNLAEIYLSDGKLPAPKFVWKVFYSPQTKKGIAFVSVNNPFVEEVTDEHYICKDVCDQYGWGTTAWKNPAKGLLYCCEINDLRTAVPNIPELEVTDVQGGNVFTANSPLSLIDLMYGKMKL